MTNLVALGTAGELAQHAEAACSLPDVQLYTESANPLDANVHDGLILLDIDDKAYWSMPPWRPAYPCWPLIRFNARIKAGAMRVQPPCVS